MLTSGLADATKSPGKVAPAETRGWSLEITSQQKCVDGRKRHVSVCSKFCSFLQGNYLYKILLFCLLSRILLLMKPYFELEIVTKEGEKVIIQTSGDTHVFDGLNRIFLFRGDDSGPSHQPVTLF